MAQLIEDAMDLREWKIVQKDIRVSEQLETQTLATTAQEQLVGNSMAPTEAPDDSDLNNEIPQDQQE